LDGKINYYGEYTANGRLHRMELLTANLTGDPKFDQELGGYPTK
jgi:hypothetical protein